MNKRALERLYTAFLCSNMEKGKFVVLILYSDSP
jgi:hypothetical protein